MASRFSVVGLNHHHTDPAQFLAELAIGDLLTLRLEPENPFEESGAIAVYLTTKLTFVGYVASSDVALLYDFFKDDPEKELKFRYSGDVSKNKDSFIVDFASRVELIEPIKVSSNVELPKSVICFDKAPYIMPEERTLTGLYKKVISDINVLLERDATDAIAKSVAEELVILLDNYIKDWANMSLSLECKNYQISIQHALDTLMSVSDTYNKTFSPYYTKVSQIVTDTRRGVNLEEIYSRQMQAITDGVERKKIMDLFLSRAFSLPNSPQPVEMDSYINDINVWLRKMPAGIAQYYAEKDNFHNLARAISNASLSYKDLYMLYAHLDMLRIVKEMHDYWQDNGQYIDYSNIGKTISVIVRKIEREFVIDK